MPSITFAGSDTSAGELETALNALVAGLISYARLVVVPFTMHERDDYQNRKTPIAFDWLAVRDDAGANAKAILAQFKVEADRLSQIAQDRATAAITAEASRHTRNFTAGVRAQTQVDLRALLGDEDLTDFLAIKSEEFNGLIRNLSGDVLQRIERETLGAIFEGRGNESIAKSIRDIDGIGRNRAKLIARDQASKLNGAMNQFRQEQVGVTHYKWRTIIDGRERPSHHANDQKVFEWAKPPSSTGHPGHDINCRCRALAILTDDPEMLAQIAEEYDTEPDIEPGGDPANADAYWNKYGKANLFAPAKAPGPVGGAHIKEFYRGPDGELWMFKPVSPAEAFRAAGEEAAYRVQRFVDPLAIEVRFIEINGKPGSIQRWQTGLADKIDFKGTPIAKIPADELAQLQREHVVDWLISQHDGHAAQFVRGKNGHVWGIDKGQVYRWLGQDKLSTDYHPNSMYGEAEPIYNTIFRAFGKGQISLDPAVAYRHAATLQAVSDTEFRAIIAPYVEGRFARFGGSAADREAFYKLALARKNGLVDEITAFYRGLDNALPPEISRLIDDVAAQGWRGKAIPLDKDGIEDHNVLVFELDRGGKTYTVMTGKFREEFNGRITQALDAVSSKAPTSAPVSADLYHARILTVIRTVNRTIDKGLPLEVSVMTDAASVAADLSRLATSTDAATAAMARNYLEWIERIENAIKTREKLPNFARFMYTPPKVEAGTGSMRGSFAQSIREESRKIGPGLRLQGNGIGGNERSGSEYRIDWTDGTAGTFRPWNGSTPYAMRGTFEVVVEGKASTTTVAKGMQRLEQWGVDVKAAQQVDIDLAYLRRQAAASNEHKVADYQTLINKLAVEQASPADQVAKLMAYWEKKLGVADLRKLPGFEPSGDYVRNGGFRVHNRFDVSDADIAEQMAEYRVVHANTDQNSSMADTVDAVLGSGGHMLAQTERLRVGIKTKTMSPTQDLETGGASYFFTRIHRLHSLDSIGEGFYWKPRVLRRMDAVTYDRDLYGRMTGGTRAEQHKAGIKGWKSVTGNTSNETVFKGSLSLVDDLDMIVARSEAERDRMIAAFRRSGIDQIDGQPLEQRIVFRGYGRPTGLNNPALEKAWGSVNEKQALAAAKAAEEKAAVQSTGGVLKLNYTLKGVPKVPSIAELQVAKGWGKGPIESWSKKLGQLVSDPSTPKALVLKRGKLLFAQMANADVQSYNYYWGHPTSIEAAKAKLEANGLLIVLKKAKVL